MTFSNNSKDRDHIIDFTKGVFVIAMVAYHTLNYFLPNFLKGFAYLSFVNKGFIFYSGFLCGTIYFKKYVLNREAVYKRLTVRALKLMLLYIVLNILVYAFIKSDIEYYYLNSRSFYDNFVLILIDGSSGITAFGVLQPIACTLLIGAPLIGLHKFKYYIYFIIIFVFVLLSFSNVTTHNANGVLVGIFGVFSGLFFNEMRDKLYIAPIRYIGILFLMAFLLFVVPYEPRSSLITIVIYIILVVYNLHSLAMLTGPSKAVTFSIDKLGQYSLFLYLTQIGVLQILKRTFKISSSSITIDHIMIFVFVNVLLLALCYLADYSRKKMTVIDKVYRFVFS